MLWNLMERRKVTEWRDGHVFKTKVVGYEWFQSGKEPEAYQIDADGFTWANTQESIAQKEKPELVPPLS